MFVILDRSDGTFHYGNGDWGPSIASAERYKTALCATWMAADLDPERWLSLDVVCADCGSVPCVPLLARGNA